MADSLEYMLACQICLEDFEESGDHVPRILPCSHSLCEKCLKQLICGNLVECPECRQKHRVINEVKTFPQNKYILAYFRRKEAGNIKNEQELNTGTCEKHGKEMTLYCMDSECSTIICQTCLTRSHRGHDVVEIEEVEKEALLRRIAAVTSCLQERKENISEARLEIKIKNRECKDKIIARKDQLIGIINERCDDLLAHMSNESECIDDSDELVDIWDDLEVLDNMKKYINKETITRKEIEDKKEAIDSLEKHIQDYSLSLRDCSFYEFEENEYISLIVVKLCAFFEESVRQTKLSDVRKKIPAVVMSLNTQVRDIWSVAPVNTSIVVLTYESDGSSKLSKFDGTSGQMLQTLELGDGARKVTEISLGNRCCVAVSYELENRIEFRDAKDLNTVVLDYSVAPHCPWGMCASSKSSLWYQWYTELHLLDCSSSPCLADAVRNLTTEEIIDDMCCVELESKSLLVTASSIEGVKVYNTRKPDLEWSAVGKFTEMEEVLDAHSVTVDRNGHLFVCDGGNHCIHAFTMDGKYLSTTIREGQQGLGKLRRIRWSEYLSGLIVTHRKGNDTWISVIKIDL